MLYAPFWYKIDILACSFNSFFLFKYIFISTPRTHVIYIIIVNFIKIVPFPVDITTPVVKTRSLTSNSYRTSLDWSYMILVCLHSKKKNATNVYIIILVLCTCTVKVTSLYIKISTYHRGFIWIRYFFCVHIRNSLQKIIMIQTNLNKYTVKFQRKRSVEI